MNAAALSLVVDTTHDADDVPEPMPERRSRYAEIDLHKRDAPIWPAVVPPLTAPEASRAVRRLYRWALGRTFAGRVEITSGNRYSYERRGVFYVNPDKGWRELAHDLSHYFFAVANPEERPHSKFHARFEAKLVREIVRRGYLDGKLADKPRAAVVAPTPVPPIVDKYRTTLARIDAAEERWQRKAKRAARALAKLKRRRTYYERALAKREQS